MKSCLLACNEKFSSECETQALSQEVLKQTINKDLFQSILQRCIEVKY